MVVSEPETNDDGPQWERVLWRPQPFPDNYVPPTFLAALSKNPNVLPYRYWPLVLGACTISQHLSAIFIFLAVFTRLLDHTLDPRLLVVLSSGAFVVGCIIWESMEYFGGDAAWNTLSDRRARAVKASLLIFLALIALAPILRTLTAPTSADSISALTTALFLVHAALADYSYAVSPVQRERLTSVLSINAAVSAAVVLASRLHDDLAVFALMLFSVEAFALFPILRRRIQLMPALFQSVVTLALGLVALAAPLPRLCAAVLASVTFGAPAVLMWAQQYKLFADHGTPQLHVDLSEESVAKPYCPTSQLDCDVEYRHFPVNCAVYASTLFPPVTGTGFRRLCSLNVQKPEATISVLPPFFGYPDRPMAVTQRSPPESSLRGREIFGKSSLDIAIHGDTDAHDSFDPTYVAKAKILNDAFSEIGMGRYQWHLFIVTGFGWLSDNLWPIVTGLIFTPVVNEFAFQGPFLKLGQNIGLLIGAVFWGVGSDIWGRRLSFNVTLLITGIFSLSAGASPNSITLCSLAAVWSVGVGGNLPVDSAVFLEFVPASHQYLLTVLSIWWAVGQLLGSLVAWPLIANFSCPTTSPPSPCLRSENQGWRYFLYTMGALMLVLFIIRFFIFQLHESPKFLMGLGRDAEAVEVVHKLAQYNGTTSSLTLDMLRDTERSRLTHVNDDAEKAPFPAMETSRLAALRRTMRRFGWDHVTPLFKTRKLAWSTSLLIALWALIGLAFPLYNSFITYFLATRGADFGDGSTYITYRNQVIVSVIGVPGALFAGWAVELRHLGRRGSLAISTALTGVFLFASTTARSSTALLGWICGYSFTSNVMYGVLYAISPELFPTKDRGTGNALVAAANRVFGIMAPIIALYADLKTSAPIYVSASLFVVSSFIALLLPFEPRGKASL